MSAVWRLGVAVVAGAAVVGTGYVVVAATATTEPVDALGPEPVTVVIDVEHTRFEPDELVVEVGTEVRFLLRNGDPIGHELIVGPPAVHDRHRHGTEAEHEPRDGELSVGPDGQGVTSYVFEQAGVVEMACHLPGHYAFGMHGRIQVVEPSA